MTSHVADSLQLKTESGTSDYVQSRQAELKDGWVLVGVDFYKASRFWWSLRLAASLQPDWWPKTFSELCTEKLFFIAASSSRVFFWDLFFQTLQYEQLFPNSRMGIPWDTCLLLGMPPMLLFSIICQISADREFSAGQCCIGQNNIQHRWLFEIFARSDWIAALLTTAVGCNCFILVGCVPVIVVNKGLCRDPPLKMWYSCWSPLLQGAHIQHIGFYLLSWTKWVIPGLETFRTKGQSGSRLRRPFEGEKIFLSPNFLRGWHPSAQPLEY